MVMERFSLTPEDNLMWIVRDNETGVILNFREGLFNDTQEVYLPDDMKGADRLMDVARTMREIGDWLVSNHCSVATCNPKVRAAVIQSLEYDRYWLTMAQGLRHLVIDFDQIHDFDYFDEMFWSMDDYIYSEGCKLSPKDKEHLSSTLFAMTDRESYEVLTVIFLYWRYKAKNISLNDWTVDVLYWPDYCPKNLLHENKRNQEERQ